MPQIIGGRRAAVLALGALVTGSVVYAVGALGAVSPTTPAASCRASLLRITLAGQVLAEPFVANDQGTPCATEDSSLIGDFDLDPIPASGKLLYSQTDTANPQSQAGVADITLALSKIDPSLPDIRAEVLTAKAGVTCTNGTPHAAGSSRVVGLSVGGDEVLVIPPDDAFAEVPADPLINVRVNEKTPTATGVTQRALHINALAGNLDVVVSEAQAGYTGNPCTTTTVTPSGSSSPTASPTPPPLPAKTGWMNGGGTMVDDAKTSVDPGSRVSHGFVLPCFKNQTPPGGSNLTVNGDFGRFKLDTVDSVKCTDDPDEGDPENPRAGFNTMDGEGTGTCNGLPAKVTWHFTDEGEPNTADEAEIHITSTPNTCHVDVVGILTNGNNQAHPLSDKGNSKPART